MQLKKFSGAASIILLFLSVIFLDACRPIRNLKATPAPWYGPSNYTSKLPANDTTKRNVFIIADSKLTEMFDMLAPFYLFNATGKANVFIVAKDKTPILIKRDLFVVPQISFDEVDSLRLKADAIVIPALSSRDDHQDPIVINWIKSHFTAKTKLLTICDGSSTGAATGLYDGKLITTHASDFKSINKHFNKPIWVQNVSVTKSGNLFSTAGVSNAVEGSLTVINELFGDDTKRGVINHVHYPFKDIKNTHKSIALRGSDKRTAAAKIFLKGNKNIGLLLQNGINEYEMAAVLDTYGRTLPSSFKVITNNGYTVQTKFGLTLISTDNLPDKRLDELHVLMPESFSQQQVQQFKKVKIVKYVPDEYLFNKLFRQIAEQYGDRFAEFVSVSLDYNY